MNKEPQDPLLLDHEYDGIRELDNKLPRWWVWLFWGCNLFGVVYLCYYHVFARGDLATKGQMAYEYEREMKIGNEIKARAVAAFENPSRQSLVPHLVPPEHFTNAVSVQTLTWTTAAILGPALAGLLVAYVDTGFVYIINALSFLAVVVSLLLMNYRGKVAASSAGLGLGALLDGLRFVFRTPIISSTMLLDFIATFFSSARTMLPIVASDILGVGAVGYGWLATADSVGAVVAGSVLATRGEQLRRQGPILLICVAIYGAATALFGVSTAFLLSFFLLMLVGAGDAISTVIRGTVRQLSTPDELRGRMTSVNMMFFMGGPQLGELEAGLVAAALGVPFAIISGGLATVALTALVAWKFPILRRYDTPTTTLLETSVAPSGGQAPA